jgi:uncharacterized protein with ParB-like and HNH nuclease domain
LQDIQGDDKTLEMLLSGSAFGIDYYQREYRWKRKHLQELIDDLYSQFSQTYGPGTALEKQSKYFLGSIVISKTGDVRNIVDGQQRITTLTLLLIYLNHLQKDIADPVEGLSRLIYAQEPDGKKFKLDIEERNGCMSALLAGEQFNPEGHPSDSVRNLVERYSELSEILPKDLSDDELRMFIWWVIRNVKLIEITANDDGDAYTIFETMNDRGLSLTPTDMLKGYLLANIEDANKRIEADKLIKSYLSKFAEHGENTEADFFKAWLRSQYAKKIRERKKEANNEDFELIGTEYHRWIRSNANDVGLIGSDAFYQFVSKNMRIFADLYLRLLKASAKRTKGLESVKYNSDAGFTLQYHIILSAVNVDDDKDTALAKMGVVADFIDSWLNVRFWNYKSNSYSQMQYAAFTVIRSIRGKTLAEVRKVLHKRLTEEFEEINFQGHVRLNQFTSNAIHRQLARFTDWLEQQADEPGKYEDYIIRSGKNAYEVEHILANKFEMFTEEFEDAAAFEEWRNYIGGLLLLPKKLNASLGDYSYTKKLPHYLKANALTQSLHPDFYSNNPGVLKAIKKYGLKFKAHEKFDGDEIEQRSNVYCALASLIWSPNRLLGNTE